jgi:hypothetical protein
VTSGTRAFLSRVCNARVEMRFNVVALRALVGATVEGNTSNTESVAMLEAVGSPSHPTSR